MKSDSESSKTQSSRKVALGCLSLALYWGCALLVAGEDAASIGHGIAWYPLAGFAGMLAALLAFGAIPHIVASKAGVVFSRVLVLAGPLACGVMSALAIIGTFDASLLFNVVSQVLLGISQGLILAHLGSFLAHCSKMEAALIAVVAFLVGTAIYVLCSGFVLDYGAVVISSLSLVSSVAFVLAGFDEHGCVHPLGEDAREAPGRALRLPKGFWPLFVGLLLYSAVYGIAIALTLFIGEGAAHTTPIELVLLVPGFISMALILRYKNSFDFLRFQWFLFAPGILAFLVLPFADRVGALACCAVIIMVFSFFDLASFILLVDLARDRGAALTMRVFAWGRLANIAGMGIGWGSAMLLLGRAFDGSGQPVAIPAFIAVTVLVLLMTFFGNVSVAPSKSKGTSEPLSNRPGREGDNFDSHCEEIACAYKLSNREAELFKLLARGRSSTYIADSLCLAPSTVKTHTNRIYRKLNVHSRQELIDLMECDHNRKDD